MWRVLFVAIIQLGTKMVSSEQICLIGTVYNNDVGSFRWALPYQDPCVCSAVRLGGTLLYKPATDGHYLEGLFVSEDPDEIKTFFDCPGLPTVRCDQAGPLGIEHDTPLDIPDGNFVASSFDNSGLYHSTPSSARLNFGGGIQPGTTNIMIGGWKPAQSYIGCWIEVNLGRDAIITGVVTQGRDAGDGKGGSNWVTRFKVKYATTENSTLVDVVNQDGTAKIFDGNTDGDTEVTNSFRQPVLAGTVRFLPIEWQTVVVFRFELLGCLQSDVTPLLPVYAEEPVEGQYDHVHEIVF